MANQHLRPGQGRNGFTPIPHPAVPSRSTPDASPRPVSPLQGDDLLLPAASLPIAMEGFAIYLQVWNALVALDREDGTLNNTDLRPVLEGAVRATVKDAGAKWLPFAEAVVREYQERRALTRNPLRFKNENRLSTIPMIGPLANLGPQDDQERRLLRRKDGSIVAVRPRSEE